MEYRVYNRRPEIPNHAACRYLANGAEALASGNKSSDRLLQIGERCGFLGDSESRARHAEGNRIMQTVGDLSAGHSVEQFRESSSDLESCLARLPSRPASFKLLA